jgi:hypothetical protein
VRASLGPVPVARRAGPAPQPAADCRMIHPRGAQVPHVAQVPWVWQRSRRTQASGATPTPRARRIARSGRRKSPAGVPGAVGLARGKPPGRRPRRRPPRRRGRTRPNGPIPTSSLPGGPGAGMTSPAGPEAGTSSMPRSPGHRTTSPRPGPPARPRRWPRTPPPRRRPAVPGWGGAGPAGKAPTRTRQPWTGQPRPGIGPLRLRNSGLRARIRRVQTGAVGAADLVPPAARPPPTRGEGVPPRIPDRRTLGWRPATTQAGPSRRQVVRSRWTGLTRARVGSATRGRASSRRPGESPRMGSAPGRAPGGATLSRAAPTVGPTTGPNLGAAKNGPAREPGAQVRAGSRPHPATASRPVIAGRREVGAALPWTAKAAPVRRATRPARSRRTDMTPAGHSGVRAIAGSHRMDVARMGRSGVRAIAGSHRVGIARMARSGVLAVAGSSTMDAARMGPSGARAIAGSHRMGTARMGRSGVRAIAGSGRVTAGSRRGSAALARVAGLVDQTVAGRPGTARALRRTRRETRG